MEKICNNCLKQIPKGRRRNSKYCSESCYLEKKSARDGKAYHKNAKHTKDIKYNEQLLALWEKVTSKIGPVSAIFLEHMGFKWGLSSGDSMYNGKILVNVGVYAYDLDKTNKTIEIWKLKES